MGGSVPGPIGTGANQPVVDAGTNTMANNQVPQSLGLTAPGDAGVPVVTPQERPLHDPRLSTGN